MKCSQLIAMGLLVAGVCWCSVMAADTISYPPHPNRSNANDRGSSQGGGRYESHRHSRTLFGQRTGLYGDPFFPGFGIFSAIAPLAFVGGLTALAAHAFGLIGGSSSSSSSSTSSSPGPASAPTTEPETTTESLQQAEDNLNASAQDEFRRRLEKIKVKGGYTDAKVHGLKVNRREYSTTYRPKSVYASTHSSGGGSKGHVSYSSANGHRYEYDYNGNRRFSSDHGKDEE